MSAHPSNTGHNTGHKKETGHKTGHLGNLELGKDQDRARAEVDRKKRRAKNPTSVLKEPKPVEKKIKKRTKPLRTPEVVTDLMRRLNKRRASK